MELHLNSMVLGTIFGYSAQSSTISYSYPSPEIKFCCGEYNSLVLHLSLSPSLIAAIRGGRRKLLRSHLGCHFFILSRRKLNFGYCRRNVCFFKIPKFQTPTRLPSSSTPSSLPFWKLS